MDLHSNLINENTKIYVPIQIDNIIECKFKDIKNYCEISKLHM